MYYGARWYDPSLGRFAQADTVLPGAGNPQAWDRYAYSLNNALKYVDPSGHDPWWSDNNFYFANVLYAGVDTYNLSLGKPYVPAQGGGNYLNTYTVAGISTQNTNPKTLNATSPRIGRAVDAWNFLGNNSGYGYAKAHLDEIKFDGYNEDDRNEPYVAIGVMQKRISSVINACGSDCTSTDSLIAASAAQNGSTTGSGFTKSTIHDFQTKVYEPCAQSGTCLNGTNLPWVPYYGSAGHDSTANRIRLKIFATNVAMLQSQGWSAPADINWNTIYNLIKQVDQMK